MSRVEVLLATMHRENTDFLKEMNIQTDIVVANQADTFAYSESTDERGNRVRFVTTAFRGLSKNRNLAFAYASGEFLIFADDDMRYYDKVEKIISNAFDCNPKADMIVFNTDEIHNDRETTRKITSVKRVNFSNFARYGSYCIAMRRSSVKKARLSMSEIFGSGCGVYSCGEDSIFLRDMMRKGFRIYTCPDCIATVDQRESKWFTGYDEKFMFDKGAVCGTLFPFFGFIFKYYFAYKFAKASSFGFFKCAVLMKKGMKYGKKGISYKEYKEGHR